MVEQWTENPRVTSSSLVLGKIALTIKTMNTLISSFLYQFNLKFFFFSNSSVLVALSGGQDSMNLIFILRIIFQQREINPIYLHCNHLWQKESTQLLFQLLQVSFANKSNILAPTPLVRLTSENISRIWRYRCLERLCFFTQTNVVLTGHTSSDKVESCLMNLIRGSSTKGITSLPEKRTIFFKKNRCFSDKRCIFKCNRKSSLSSNSLTRFINYQATITIRYKEEKFPIILFRPFLMVNRYQVMVMSKFFLLPIWTDKTNFEFKYLRNRIRYQLLPAIRYFVNPNVDLSILKYINSISEEANYLNLVTLKTLKHVICKTSKKMQRKHIIVCKHFILKQLPVVFKKKLIVHSLGLIGYKSINSTVIYNLVSLLFLISSRKNNKIQTVFYSNSLTIIYTETYFIFENRS